MRAVLKILAFLLALNLVLIFAGDAVKGQNASIPTNFVQIKGGTFIMGSPDSEVGRYANEVQHKVTVSSFYMSKYQVTQKEYKEVMGTNPSKFIGYNLPVEQVTWYNAIEYCNKLSIKEELTPAYTINGNNVTWNKNANGYRLPTEAEWEYACRAGTTTPFNTGNNITTAQANYNGKKTTPVGAFAPNSWGLYDMHGNVWEWCWDLYGFYSKSDQTNPDGEVSGAYRVMRGGSWYGGGKDLRSAYRGVFVPSNQYSYIGFRLVRP